MLIVICRDYAPNELLDRYSDADLDDQGEYDDLAPAARRAAEARMAQRDRREQRGGRGGTRAANRRPMPQFLQSDDEEEDDDMDGGLGVRRMATRTRRQYDVNRDIDDLEGVEDVRTRTSFYKNTGAHNFYRRFHSNNLVTLRPNQSLNGSPSNVYVGPLSDISVNS